MLVRLRDWNSWPRLAGFAGPFAPLSDFRREFDRLFADFEHGYEGPAGETPELRLTDAGNAFVVEAELPGVSDKEIELNVVGNSLTLKVARTEQPPQGYTALRKERTNYKFSHSYELSAKVDPERVQATLKQGLLTVTLPKAAGAEPRRISVKAG